MTGLASFTQVLRQTRGAGLPVVASQLAAAGVPVFPCAPGAKRPLTEHGFYDATTDPGQVEQWWGRYPEANIGVPTGQASNLVVVDVDVHPETDGYAAFARSHRAGLTEGWGVLVSTPSGGMHAYYPVAPGVQQRSWQAAAAGVDFRGDGGYIIVPPSVVQNKGSATCYRMARIAGAPPQPVDASGLREFLDPRSAPAFRRTAPGPRREADVSRLASWVAARGEGERNRGLFWAACRLAENNIPAGDAVEVLSAAASQAGLGQREISATIRSAYRTTHIGTAREPHGQQSLAPGVFARRRQPSAEAASQVRGLG
ncbi:bifunctional DNA primase/polymerase [Nesterenkonia populi]|uniref:bifunctional DNA primase/polymerase n=1 Tax=Nesterenkonia populi TaxID=1591087 RepID=UPI0011BF251F|nr:bifunctional DNA primase/polymerase [Nesterenkonia populi]